MREAVGIVGAGAMGRGIAEVAATAGLPTVLIKATAGSITAIRVAFVASLDRAVARGKLEQTARERAIAGVTITSDLAALAGCDLVIESVIEDLAAKRRLMIQIERSADPGAIVASNTSSLRIGEIGTPLTHPERLLGMHFFNPAPAMKLVELAPTSSTEQRAIDRAERFVLEIGKTPVIVEDSPGYIVNRLLVPYLLDGMKALESGLASASSIDLAMRLGCGHPIGPLALSDTIGLDVVLAMARSLYGEHCDARYSPTPLLRRLVTAGQLGRKSGIGIYDYRVDPPIENRDLRFTLEPENCEVP